ncbi:hypothetical protein FH972_021653 [Carpinus fangiana]|uniref:Homoserine dehydrogenase n=1 Tax=Carpinus fangiana TaxID=176857 RepID=A0A5N6KQB3_9ROSI|nr:hypothetical protein FH972_021653 [Carpinus fangiana]
MSVPKNVYVAVIGTGGVGKAFLSQLEALSHRYLSSPTPKTRISLVYAARSSKAVLANAYHDPIPISSWSDSLNSSSTPPLEPPALADFLAKAPAPGRAVVIDNTSNEDIARSYPIFLSKGVSVVTPNKKAFSSDLDLWKAIFAAAANGSGPATAGYIYHEASVGAGLPIISTVKDLIETGDIITRIEGVLSGTMSFLFNSFMPIGGANGGGFSAEVRNARDLGYTEPDPRDDLNGLDVARKCTVLARLAGVPVASPTSFPVQSLIPKELENVKTGEEFVDGLPQFDAQIEAVKQEAAKEGKVLRYVGTVDVTKGECEVGLRKFDPSHPIGGLKGSDNIFSFYTKRYETSPLVIQGSGAGAEVTAMGILADFIKVCGLL